MKKYNKYTCLYMGLLLFFRNVCDIKGLMAFDFIKNISKCIRSKNTNQKFMQLKPNQHIFLTRYVQAHTKVLPTKKGTPYIFYILRCNIGYMLMSLLDTVNVKC